MQPEDGSFWNRWSQSWVEAKSRIPLEWGEPKRWVGVVETGYTDKACGKSMPLLSNPLTLGAV